MTDRMEPAGEGRPSAEEIRRMRQRGGAVQADLQRRVYAILTDRQEAFMDEKVQAFRAEQDAQADERYMERMEGKFTDEFEAQRQAVEMPNSVRRRLMAMTPEERARFWARVESELSKDR